MLRLAATSVAGVSLDGGEYFHKWSWELQVPFVRVSLTTRFFSKSAAQKIPNIASSDFPSPSTSAAAIFKSPRSLNVRMSELSVCQPPKLLKLFFAAVLLSTSLPFTEALY